MDRNAAKMKVGGIDVSSLSARRAWIEIDPVTDKAWALEVALRKESVDRNWYHYGWSWYDDLSLSARRAWIEMMASRLAGIIAARSLSARRAWIEIAGQPAHGLPSIGRSPQGERG